MSASPNWNSLARANAAQKWRKQSATMGSALTEAIVQSANVQAGMAVLDVACGTGEPAISIASQLAGTGSVVGIDISSEPLKIAEQRAAARGFRNISFQQCDAHQLPFEDRKFDRITSRLGVMFFADPSRVFREMHRVLKPGGAIAFVSWGPFEAQPYFQSTIGTIIREVPGAVVPATGASMFRYGRPGSVSQELEAAGFHDCKDELKTVPWVWPGPPEDVWEYVQEATVPFRSLIDGIPAASRDRVHAAVLSEIRNFYDGNQLNFTAAVNLSTATA